MDEAQVAVETTAELARIAQELNNLQMLFFLTVLVILAFTFIVLLFWRSTTQASKSDASIQSKLLIELSSATHTAGKAIETFSEERKVFWERNTREHRQVINYMRQVNRVLRQVVVTLDQLKTIQEVHYANDNEVDTEPMESHTANIRPVKRISPVINPNL